MQRAQHLSGIDANPPVKDLFPQRYVALAVSAFRNAIGVEELQDRIHREFEGDFTELELDVAQPLGNR